MVTANYVESYLFSAHWFQQVLILWIRALERKKMCWYETCFGPPYTLLLIESFISFSVLRLKNDAFFIMLHYNNSPL